MHDVAVADGVDAAAVLNAAFDNAIVGHDATNDQIAVTEQIQTTAFTAPTFFNQFIVEDATAFNGRTATERETAAITGQVTGNQAVANRNQAHGLHTAAHAVHTAADSLAILDDQTIQYHGSRQWRFAATDDAADFTFRLRQNRRIRKIPCVSAVFPHPPFRQRRLVSFETTIQRHTIFQFEGISKKLRTFQFAHSARIIRARRNPYAVTGRRSVDGGLDVPQRRRPATAIATAASLDIDDPLRHRHASP